ncbi:MAG: hypothetical protein JXR41_03525 [Bacteroidales bacterium]|nr:hypothetical protein [Bacteroidales bacterium]
MSFADGYLSKQQGLHTHIPDPPSPALQFAVIIPACREENIITVLDSLRQCLRPEGAVENIVVVNAPENAGSLMREINTATLRAVKDYSRSYTEDGFRFYGIDATDMPSRHAGVGLARKTGMDEAIWRFNSISRPKGLLISLDADCLCDNNYFIEIERNNKTFPQATGFNLYFEHPVSGDDFPRQVYQGITGYELHLRYYVQALRYAKYPYAFHTVGSCYAVKADAYARQGGMNRRKSGEDFYFLHKIFPLGNFYEINTTRVIPSPRPSLRVPFGTGPTMQKYLDNEQQVQMTYDPELFEIMEGLFSGILQLYKQNKDATEKHLKKLHPLLYEFLSSISAVNALAEINANCSSAKTFIKRFYNWFDGLTVLKFLNYASARSFPKVKIQDAAQRLLQMKQWHYTEASDSKALLLIYRKMERKTAWVSPPQR